MRLFPIPIPAVRINWGVSWCEGDGGCCGVRWTVRLETDIELTWYKDQVPRKHVLSCDEHEAGLAGIAEYRGAKVVNRSRRT